MHKHNNILRINALAVNRQNCVYTYSFVCVCVCVRVCAYVIYMITNASVFARRSCHILPRGKRNDQKKTLKKEITQGILCVPEEIVTCYCEENAPMPYQYKKKS